MALASIAILASCAQDGEPFIPTGDALQINVSMTGFTSGSPETRTTDAGYTTSFAPGDQIGITVIQDGVIRENNIPYVYGGSSWNPIADPAYPYTGGTVTYLVYYPYSAAMNGKTSAADIVAAFTPKTDQSAQADYAASDLLTGTGSLSGSILSTTLTHALALVEVSLPASATSVTLSVGGASVTPYVDGNVYRYLSKPVGTTTVSGGYTSFGTQKGYSKSVALAAGKYARLNVDYPFYEGDILVTYTDASDEHIAAPADGDALPLTSGAGKTVKSIRLLDVSTTPEYFIGRDGAEQIVLRLANNGNLLFRPAVDGYIPIGSYAEFRLIDANNTTRGGTYKQEAALDLMSVSWTPIHPAISGSGFTGTFDGNGYAINNLLVNTRYAGLFGHSNGTIKNVRIASGSVTGQDMAAGVVVYNNTGGTIIACSNAATVTATSPGASSGGMAGLNIGTIIASYNTGTLTATGSNSYAGGVAGNSDGLGTITASYNTGTVTATYRSGGVAGYGATTASYSTTGGGGGNGTQFGVSAWPTAGENAAWTAPAGADGTTNQYWKDLGGWNSGTPTYPKLWWE
ncbi:hypothetical protein FACS1894177_02770 [Bacteroidia bacterium]|nr:hypothetical protein FACS1894177_02770 [Bacteroidia bacterium]